MNERYRHKLTKIEIEVITHAQGGITQKAYVVYQAVDPKLRRDVPWVLDTWDFHDAFEKVES